MGSKIRALANLATVLAWSCLGPHSQPFSTPACEAKLTVRMYSRAARNADIPSRAERYVERAFKHAGVELRWLHCTPSAIRESPEPSCRDDAKSAWTKITIVPNSMVKAERSSYAVFGLTLPGGVVIFSNKIRDFARWYGFSDSEVLAIVMAHELGHVLLGLHHGSTGVMLADLTPQDVRSFMSGTLRFTQPEAELMQAHLNWRIRQMGGGGIRALR